MEPNSVIQMDAARVAYDSAGRSEQFLMHVDELRQSLEKLEGRINTLQTRQANLLAQTVVQPTDKVGGSPEVPGERQWF